MTQYEKDVIVFLLIIISVQSIYIFSQWLYKDEHEPKMEKIIDIEMTTQESPEQIPPEQLDILTEGELYGTNI